MATLQVHLQEGFEGEPVVLRLGGRIVADRPSVSTRPQLGLAEIVRLDVPPGHHVLEVALPARHRSEEIPFDLDRELHLALSLERDGTLRHRSSESTFGYV